MDTKAQKSAKRDPDGTRRRIFAAATDHFSTLGLAGARTVAIANSAGTDERMLYHYFGDKERLYVAVLESMCEEFATRETALDLSGLEPDDAIRKFAESVWTHLWDSPQWLGLINNENLHHGRHLMHSEKLRATISPVVAMLASILQRGTEKGQFRDGVDPLDFYVTLVGMGCYIVSNRFTITAFTGRNYAEQPYREAISAMQLKMLLADLDVPKVQSQTEGSVGHRAKTLLEEEAAVRNALAAAQRALERTDSDEGRKRAEVELAEAGQALGLIQVATQNAKPYRGLVFQCSACRNLFNNEGSYLAHWQHQSGSTRCISTLSTLKAMGFVVERPQYRAGGGPEYVLKLPSLS
jgi:AcrR family transcriptional regulator